MNCPWDWDLTVAEAVAFGVFACCCVWGRLELFVVELELAFSPDDEAPSELPARLSRSSRRFLSFLPAEETF